MDNQARTAPLGWECPNKTRRWLLRLSALAWVIVLFYAAPTAAQDINETVTIEDLGFTRRLTAGARPTALAGAYAALSLDVHSLVYNPAGLVGVTSQNGSKNGNGHVERPLLHSAEPQLPETSKTLKEKIVQDVEVPEDMPAREFRELKDSDFENVRA